MALSRNTFFNLFETWYRQNMPSLYNYVCFKVKNRSVAEDIISAICEKALRNCQQYDSQNGSLNNWIFGIARNTLRNHFRAQGSSSELTSLKEFLVTTNNDDLPEPSIERDEVFTQLLSNIERLSEREQEVISLRFGAGMKNKEIAVHLDLDPNHINVIVYRILKNCANFI
jgi:RNA polymerase sigma factor (sigma-70 family)